jgi:hypothetical protein
MRVSVDEAEPQPERADEHEAEAEQPRRSWLSRLLAP